MMYINNKILTKLLEPIDTAPYDYTEVEDCSEESGDENESEARIDPSYRYYLSDLISKQYEEILE